jgi:hypothetical protein
MKQPYVRDKISCNEAGLVRSYNQQLVLPAMNFTIVEGDWIPQIANNWLKQKLVVLSATVTEELWLSALRIGPTLHY